MASLTLRLVKGSPLTNAELDANFSNLNTDVGSRLLASSNLSDLANATTARSNLGLGNVENKSSATIRSELTSTNVTTALGYTPLAPSAIGSTVQAYDADLATIAGLTPTADNFIVGNGTAWVLETPAQARTSLGLGSLATLSSINNSNWSGTALAVANGGTGATDAATARTNLGLAIGTNVQAWDADLDAIAGLAGTSGFLKKTAANTWSLDTNTYLTGNQSISLSGDATGSGTTSIAVTLANSGVTAGTYTKVTVDAKGRVTTGASLASADLPTYTGTLTSSQVTTALGYTPLSTGGGTVTGNLSVNGNTTLGDASTDAITLTGTVQPGVVISGSSTSDALRITQAGSGNALLVEDSANPDATPFVVTADGNVGIGNAAPTVLLNMYSATGAVAQLTGDSNTTFTIRRASDDTTSGIFGFNKRRGTIASSTIVQAGDVLGTLSFTGYDGVSQNIPGAQITAAVDGTPGTSDMPGRLMFSTTADGAASSKERMRITSAGNVLVGTTTNSNNSLLVVNGTISETVGSTQYLVVSQADIGTEPNDIPLNQYLGSMAYQDNAAVNIAGGIASLTALTVGGPTTLNVNSSSDALRITQVGSGNALYIEDVASDSTPFVVSSTGVVGIGTTTPDNVTSAGIALVSNNGYYPQLIQRNTTADANASYIGLEKSRNGGIVQSGDIIGNIVFRGFDGTQFLQAAAIWSRVAATPGTNDMPGDLVFGTTPDGAPGISERFRIDRNGAALAVSNTGGLGYGPGAGGAQTQGSGSGKATGVTLNAPCGQITMNNASLGGATAVSFTLANSIIAATDVVSVTISGGATAGAYVAAVDQVSAGSCRISLRNLTGSALSEAVVINFAVVKAVSA